MNVKRFRVITNSPAVVINEHKDGEWVSFEDYKWMADYADRLVEFGNLPCLPKDLENLREANTALAMENQALQEALVAIKGDLIRMTL